MNTNLVYIDPATERFAVALSIAAIIHAVIIYGVGFAMPKFTNPLNTTMEIILVQKSTEQAPTDANQLAQVNYEGGGDSEQDVRPATPTIAPFPDQTAEIVLTNPPPQIAATPDENKIEKIVTEQFSEHKIEQFQEVNEPDEAAEQGYDSQNSISEDYIAENILFLNVRATKHASIQAELDKKFENHAKRPRKKFINASTKEYKYANYMVSWRRTIERIGTLNYPEEASHNNISGYLILDVAINADGTIYQVEIKTPSEYKILDEAALRIVRLAAPYAPFPEDIRTEIDILHITRTWIFSYDSLITR
ncbi:TonB family protein [Candidatus Parabeggiatoa sp. HSG14]|uniref:energy transducer TonB n=1 Tax=Candidatus Parabeggiatoa sp. HSG14 TaxID=3055593 RepID=UPI0025A7563C|nr:TonB family protein [Thiotrichales bacterium HSG14]